jgi:cell division protein FtsW (lipid II flippase)
MSAAGTVTPGVTQRRGFRRFWLALKQLFHEVIGAIFGVLALFWIQNALRAWSRDGARWLIGAAAFLALVMAAFSYTSFRNAKRVQSS